MLLRITSGSQNGQERTVTNWVKSTGTFTVSPAFGGQILSGVTYEVGVTLPYDPGKIEDDNPPEVQTQKMPGTLPFIIAFGRKERKIRAEGYLFQSGWTKAQLESSYVKPLSRITGRKVSLDADDTRYDGDYIFKVTWVETPGFVRSFTYKMEFLQGSDYVVL